MLEGRSCMISRALPSSCEPESKWYCMTFPVEVSKGKRRLEDEGEEVVLGKRKPFKRLGNHETEAVTHILYDFFSSSDDQFDLQGHDDNQEDKCNNLSSLVEERALSERVDTSEKEEMISSLLELRLSPSNTQVKKELAHNLLDLRLSPFNIHDQEDQNGVKVDVKGKRPLDEKGDEELGERKTSKRMDMTLSFHDLKLSTAEQSEQQCHTPTPEQSARQAHDGDQVDTSSLILPLGRDISINCLLRCSRSIYNSIAPLNRSFCKLIREGEIYRLRRQLGIIEHWVYFSCDVLKWEAFDPIHRRWMRLPRMPSNECFRWSDKESLAVSTELLVFGKEITSHVIWKYSILTNSWSSGMQMNTPRCLFGSASLGEIAIVAGGCDSQGAVNSAELYNSETGTWETLPSMHKPRKMCSGVFMDGKFYVIGGSNSEFLSCGEEYNLQTRTWRKIENMFPRRNGPTEAPPLVAVVNNELYLADCVEKEVKKYDKENVSWFTVGRLPEQAVSMNGWGLAFRACGDQLIVIGGPRALVEGTIELNSWVPKEGPPQWNLLARKQSGSFVYNCAVMGC